MLIMASRTWWLPRTLRARAAAGDRPSRRFRERVAGDQVVARPISATVFWFLCGWLGLAWGLVESVVGLGWRVIEHRVGAMNLWVHWHSAWMGPLSLAGWFLLFGVAASVVRVVLPRTTTAVVPMALMAAGAWSAVGSRPGLHPWAAWLLVAGLVVRLGPRARFESAAFQGFARRSLPVLGGLWLALAVATGIEPATREARALAWGPTPPAGAPNVLLVVIDTARADHLGMDGYARSTTPRLDARARAGVRFAEARATTPYTLGTHASLFTGRWMPETSARVDTPLDGRYRTLAEHLRDRGYATAGITGNIFYGSARYGLDRGFLHYHDTPGNVLRRITPREFLRSCALGEAIVTHCERKWHILNPMQRQRLDASYVTGAAIDWIDTVRPSGRPFFLFANLFDAHSDFRLPPEAPQPWATRTADVLEQRLDRMHAAERRQDARPTTAGAAEVTGLRADTLPLLLDSYDDGLAWIDRHLDALLDDLARRGLLDSTLVVITADHGEMLGEHGRIGHGQSLDREVVRVPLIVLGNKALGVPAGVVVPGPASLRDVPATILDLIGDPDAGGWPGESLRGRWAGDAAVGSPVLSEMEAMPWEPRAERNPAASGTLALLTEGRWAYHQQEHETIGRVERLFDLEADPSEIMNLAADASLRATLERLRRRLDEVRAGR